ncbi:uncharacterized protein CIMG_06249 [Coccidioides immitis RS]|uniref:Molybdate-anion transporter n=7 Tax=Coccidioides TaxID=5500 RepID=A0A0E1RWM4_COCIM|nr:uncharacterized protein CIMG_06249 [Coccidioides immitis RS]XP_003069590.1 Major Facilitator Superfamily protein [Coccidioides posadasii C735 delta SOWgp]EFW22930.1 conserved hypothetical protein [Coccidioides posadasii str. Silveira]KMM67277.1 major facilitator superfamily domain-containing protein 5 [Coccidioides posadasii RMSCC 3488]KMP03351.1 major facilitator superfamily protein domain-containing protein 5 [Coccidioides immitis RMSCC 2394]KMU73890.1 major facilitator superfamily domain|eukprot:XP_003069590.1 Major Facilitator Superfamily protein [Coccidioides posadasii C735 delta SOWgp]
MAVDLYLVSLAAWVLANATIAFRRWDGKRSDVKISDTVRNAANQTELNLKYTYFVVYILVVASDWLQGPYLYPLYKQTLQLPENIVAALFSTGFVSGALSATFVGSLADRYGRRKACLFFCVIYSLSCLLTVSPSSVYLLFLGRLLGGIGTTLLFTVFETWLVAEFHRLELEKEGAELNDLLGTMTILNTIVAVASGLLSELLVGWTESKRSPFLASIFCLGLAFFAILRKWGENYGDEKVLKGDSSATHLMDGISAVIKDGRVLTLGIASTIFEGTMYLFVVFWSPAIISAERAADTSVPQNPPFGLIFASFMAAMMFGSQVFAYLMRPSSSQLPLEQGNSPPPALVRSSCLLKVLLPVASSCLSWSVLCPTRTSTLWAFCLYEMTIGVYFPSMGVLKSVLVDDRHRASIYALFRVPLNIFVVAGLALTKEGEGYRNTVFLSCSALLLAAMGFAHLFLKH